MPAAAIARFVVLEARRSGLPWLVAASVAAGLGLAAFLSQVAVAESEVSSGISSSARSYIGMATSKRRWAR